MLLQQGAECYRKSFRFNFFLIKSPESSEHVLWFKLPIGSCVSLGTESERSSNSRWEAESEVWWVSIWKETPGQVKTLINKHAGLWALWVLVREQLESLKWGCLSCRQLTKCVAYSYHVSRCFLLISFTLMESNFKSLFRGIHREARQLCARWRSCKVILDRQEYTRERDLKSWER